MRRWFALVLLAPVAALAQQDDMPLELRFVDAPGGTWHIRNATVWTQDGPGILESADVLIRDGKILAVGRDGEIAALRGPHTQVIEGAGNTVLPGLVDGHAHMDREGLKETLPSLAGCRSIADVKARIRALAEDSRGWLYFSTDSGKIFRLRP